MTPYSQDLRQRILETVQRREGSLRQIAQRFLVSLSFVVRLLQTYRRTGLIQPRPHGGGNPAIASGKLERGGRGSNSETFHATLRVNESRPAELGQQPEASLAWWRGDLPCEA
jgi:transposase